MEYFIFITRTEGLVVAILLIITILAIRKRWWNNYRKNEGNKRLMQSGVEAEAIVLDIQPTGLFINNMPQLRVQMKVQPDRGRNFVTETQQVLPDVYFGQLHSGSKVIVKYDPHNPKEIVLLRAS